MYVDSNRALLGAKSAAAFECFMSARRQLNKMSTRRQLHLLAPNIVPHVRTNSCWSKKACFTRNRWRSNATVIRTRDWFEKLSRSNDVRFQEMDLFVVAAKAATYKP
jgi:hypothetical protein